MFNWETHLVHNASFENRLFIGAQEDCMPTTFRANAKVSMNSKYRQTNADVQGEPKLKLWAPFTSALIHLFCRHTEPQNCP